MIQVFSFDALQHNVNLILDLSTYEEEMKMLEKFDLINYTSVCRYAEIFKTCPEYYPRR